MADGPGRTSGSGPKASRVSHKHRRRLPRAQERGFSRSIWVTPTRAGAEGHGAEGRAPGDPGLWRPVGSQAKRGGQGRAGRLPWARPTPDLRPSGAASAALAHGPQAPSSVWTGAPAHSHSGLLLPPPPRPAPSSPPPPQAARRPWVGSQRPLVGKHRLTGLQPSWAAAGCASRRRWREGRGGGGMELTGVEAVSPEWGVTPEAPSHGSHDSGILGPGGPRVIGHMFIQAASY